MNHQFIIIQENHNLNRKSWKKIRLFSTPPEEGETVWQTDWLARCHSRPTASLFVLWLNCSSITCSWQLPALRDSLRLDVTTLSFTGNYLARRRHGGLRLRLWVRYSEEVLALYSKVYSLFSVVPFLILPLRKSLFFNSLDWIPQHVCLSVGRVRVRWIRSNCLNSRQSDLLSVIAI